MDEARRIRDFWFGSAPLSADALNRRIRFWFGDPSAALRQRRDAQIETRFGALLERAAKGELAAWADGPRRRLSLIIVLDQFPRSLFRGTARAFACDTQALALALSGMQAGADAALTAVERIFFYMPLQHAESPEVQEESVAAYRRLLAEAPEPVRQIFAGALRSAENHRSIIDRFGRFPQRNRALGRDSTPEELAWLRAGGGSFGQ
ncbi:MAG TPA: DUF924 family protein [Steroidobacteraceae bacterium]|nr:DUF924 family protein [Steroidobacteraceae bacterium]